MTLPHKLVIHRLDPAASIVIQVIRGSKMVWTRRLKGRVTSDYVVLVPEGQVRILAPSGITLLVDAHTA